jgi:hypothetical protein
MAPDRLSTSYYRCRVCGTHLPAWLPIAKRPEASMLPAIASDSLARAPL